MGLRVDLNGNVDNRAISKMAKLPSPLNCPTFQQSLRALLTPLTLTLYLRAAQRSFRQLVAKLALPQAVPWF